MGHDDMHQAADGGATSGLPEIRVLPDVLANQIAAGEVVERPASVVKELVENSLDAGADRIEVRIESGGRRLIRVEDNGHGMVAAQARLALMRHATSKIRSVDDLFHIRSLGFRGEALPSIASVSHLELASRVAGEVDGVRIAMKGGAEAAEQRVVMPVGTQITVQNLFYNTPARLKFLRAERTEAGHVSDCIQRLALANPHCGFRLLHNNREMLSIQAGHEERFLRQRLEAVFGADFTDNCLELHGEQEQSSVSGWIGLPELSRSSAMGMHFFVNGRWVRDKMIIQAVREAYRGVMPRERYPVLALFLSVPPGDVDVNVHPTKQEVRFQQKHFVFSLVRRAILSALTQAGGGAAGVVPEGTAGEAVEATLPEAVSRPVRWDPPRLHPGAAAELVELVGADAPSFPARPAPSMPAERRCGFRSPPWQRRLDLDDPLPGGGERGGAQATAAMPAEPERGQRGTLGRALGQIRNSYIVAQSDQGLVLVDQHAAHERIVYESLKRAHAESRPEGQMLLLPEILQLAPGDAARVAAQLPELNRLGIGVEPFGGNTFAVRELPAPLAGGSARGLVLDLVSDLEQFGHSDAMDERMEKLLTTMACHGSVRAGRKMTVEEMDGLLRKIESTPHAGQCGHGRPTYIILDTADLEKMFGRR